MGGSGDGKTTLFKLLQEFYVPDGGNIYYFGVDRRNMDIKDIRKMIAYVPQDCFLFDE